MKRCLDKRNAKLTRAVKRNINSIARLEQEFLRQRSAVACLSDWITDVIGSPIFIVGHLVCLTAWIVLNTVAIPGVPQFDPYPCPLLALGIAVEGVLFATFVLMSQKRQLHQANHWAHVDLQVNLLAEQEATKILHCCMLFATGSA
jgi:CRP/FNR family cyclic AMP-dependent transcriptional regulator